mgnify:CR=1 FL=1
MFYYLIHNSTIIKKDTLKNKNVTTLIYGTIVYILIHALIYVNKSIKDTLLRYFWVIFSVDIISIFLSTEISSEIQNHNFSEIKSKIYFNPELFIFYGRVASLTISSLSIFILFLFFKKLKINTSSNGIIRNKFD